MSQEVGKKYYLEIQQVVEKLFTQLSDSQKDLVIEALKNDEKNATYIKGKSLVNLICHDFCLYKYPFSEKYDFDYENCVNIFLESERYGWLIQSILITIDKEFNFKFEDEDIKVLYVLSGAFTLESNNKNRQKKITELRKILYYIFELNSICTMFTRPNFSSNVQYKQTLNDIQQKIKNKLSFALDLDCEDMKHQRVEDYFESKLKKPVFNSWLNFLGEVNIVSIGETTKQNSNGLLCYEILNLLQCFKEAEEAQDFIQERLLMPSEASQNLSIVQESCLFAMSYMIYSSKKNVILIDQELDQRVEKSFNYSDEIPSQPSSFLFNSSTKTQISQDSDIKSQIDSTCKQNDF